MIFVGAVIVVSRAKPCRRRPGLVRSADTSIAVPAGKADPVVLVIAVFVLAMLYPLRLSIVARYTGAAAMLAGLAIVTFSGWPSSVSSPCVGVA